MPDDVEEGPFGLKNRSALRDDRYRRWLQGTRLLFLLACIAAGVVLRYPTVLGAGLAASNLYVAVAGVPVTVAAYARGVMHIRLKAALVGTKLTKRQFRGTDGVNRIESEAESVQTGYKVIIAGTAIPLVLYFMAAAN
jgi:hypothetical protein